MRYLRKQVLNRRAPFDTRFYIDATSGVVMANSNNITLPKSQNTIVSPQTGMMRYNTSSNEVEVYQGSSASWRAIRYKESTGITQQSLGNGDYIETTFGPLNPAPPTIVQSGASWGGQNLLVIVENVIQVFNTNYTITQAPANGKTGTGYWITFSSPVPGGKPVTVLHGFDK
jgi:hypothetical protein